MFRKKEEVKRIRKPINKKSTLLPDKTKQPTKKALLFKDVSLNKNQTKLLENSDNLRFFIYILTITLNIFLHIYRLKIHITFNIFSA